MRFRCWTPRNCQMFKFLAIKIGTATGWRSFPGSEMVLGGQCRYLGGKPHGQAAFEDRSQPFYHWKENRFPVQY